jgi:hypothetical protein
MEYLSVEYQHSFIIRDLVENIPEYAILSHSWEMKVTFADFSKGSVWEKGGVEKIRLCTEQATIDGIRHFCIDTYYINRSEFFTR